MSVSYEDVGTSLGRSISTAAEQAQITQWIGFAGTVIRGRLGDLTLLDQDVLDYVITEAVAQRVKRPDTSSQTTVAVDDATVTRRYEKDSGQITITDTWWDMLTPLTRNGTVFSARPTFDSDTTWFDPWTYTTP